MSSLLRLAWWVTTGLLIMILATVTLAQAASNTVPLSGAGTTSTDITANSLKPSACSSFSVLNIVVGSGTINGTSSNDLILGSSGADIITGRGGSDCILGGGGNDTIKGSGGADICIGGPGTDTFISCKTSIQ